jgi:phosphohistidine phosphatase
MPKTLLLMRHAEAGTAPSQRDFDRQLTPNGEAMPSQVALYVQRLQLAPQKIICSPAARTRATAKLFMENLKEQPQLVVEEKLYGAAPEDVLDIIHAESDAERLMVIGHNPWVHMLALTLSKPQTLMDHAAMKSIYPPASCAVLQVDGAWADVARATCSLTDFYYPAKGMSHG